VYVTRCSRCVGRQEHAQDDSITGRIRNGPVVVVYRFRACTSLLCVMVGVRPTPIRPNKPSSRITYDEKHVMVH